MSNGGAVTLEDQVTSGKPGGGGLSFEDELPVHIEDRSRVFVDDGTGQQAEVPLDDGTSAPTDG